MAKTISGSCGLSPFHVALGLSSLSPEQLERPDTFKQWGISANDEDQNGPRILGNLANTWREWQADWCWLLVRAVEAIADAEDLKAERRPNQARLCIDLTVNALQAARTAKQFSERYALSSSPAIRHTVEQLAAFAVCAVEETSGIEQAAAAGFARSMLDDLARKTTGHKTASNELIGELVWLVRGKSSGDEQPLHESSIRRYGRNTKPTSAAAKSWRRSWKLIREVSQLVPSRIALAGFRQEIREFLGIERPSTH